VGEREELISSPFLSPPRFCFVFVVVVVVVFLANLLFFRSSPTTENRLS